MSEYETNLLNKIKESREKVETLKRAKAEQREAERDLKAITNPNFSMSKLSRLVLTADEPFFMAPMHSFDLSWDMLIHSPKIVTNGKTRYTHLVCPDVFARNTCEHCKTYEKMLEESPKTAWEYDARHVKVMVMFVFNALGEKRSFTG